MHLNIVIHQYVQAMAEAQTCPVCGYCTTSMGNYNKHIQKYKQCKPKQTEKCLLCNKQCKVGGSTLRKHVCQASATFESFEAHLPVESAREELKKLNVYEFKRLGFASNPIDAGLAAFKHISTQDSRSTRTLHCASLITRSSQLLNNLDPFLMDLQRWYGLQSPRSLYLMRCWMTLLMFWTKSLTKCHTKFQ